MKRKSIRYFLYFALVFLGVGAFVIGKEKFHRSKKISSKFLEEKPFVVIIPSFNNSAYCEQNLLSVLSQNYKNFRLIYIDDASTDDTLSKVTAFLERSPLREKISIIHNKENQGSLNNIYTAIHSCQDHEIAVLVDGDDFLAHPHVLKKLNVFYHNRDTWMTYGNYLDYPSYQQKPLFCEKFPSRVIQKNSFRRYKWVASHLKTFYIGLFKKIAKEDLLWEGKFLPMASDLAFMLPLLEMSGPHCKFIREPLYLYNRLNPLNDHKKNLQLQATCAQYVRQKMPYTRLITTPYFLKQEELHE